MQLSQWFRRLIGVAILAVLLSSCGQATEQAAAPSADTITPQAAHTEQASRRVSDARVTPFNITTLDGDTFSVTDSPGRPVMLFFSAAWCASCVPKVQALAQLQEEYGADKFDVLVLDVDPGSTVTELKAFKQATGLQKHWALDLDGRVTQAYRVQALETTILIAPDGRITYRDARPTFDALDSAIQQVLQ